MAALTASCLVAGDVDEALRLPAAVVPPHSELAAAITFGTLLGRTEADLDARLNALHERDGHLH